MYCAIGFVKTWDFSVPQFTCLFEHLCGIITFIY
uniref:Uncharacterized protein n=1 Tax=Anguilla anguilla TaxID=7936 RepID=A0A0E9TYR3_ANGAN